MRYLSLDLDLEVVGCGERFYLEVSEGRFYAYLLYVPTLTRIKLPRADIAEQVNRKPGGWFVGRVLDVPKDMRKRIKAKAAQWDRFKLRYSEVFVKEALDNLKQAKGTA